MNYRNAKYINDNGWIDCEIEHPQFGWIPYTLDPADTDMTVNNDDLLAAMAKNKANATTDPVAAAHKQPPSLTALLTRLR